MRKRTGDEQRDLAAGEKLETRSRQRTFAGFIDLKLLSLVVVVLGWGECMRKTKNLLATCLTLAIAFYRPPAFGQTPAPTAQPLVSPSFWSTSTPTVTPSLTPTPTPSLSAPHRDAKMPLVDLDRSFTFQPSASASAILTILQNAGVADGAISRSFDARPLSLSSFSQELAQRPLTQRLTSIKTRFAERTARGIGNAPTDRMDRTWHVHFTSADRARTAQSQLKSANLIEQGQPLIRIKQILPKTTPAPRAVAPAPSPGSEPPLDQSYLASLRIPTDVAAKITRRPIVAVVDTGVYHDHPDLVGAIWENTAEVPGNAIDDDNNGVVDDYYGANFSCDLDSFGGSECLSPNIPWDTDDQFGHGTHVAGIIAGQKVKSSGVQGVARQAIIMPVKGLSNGGSGLSSWLAASIVYAANNGADVINNSWGSIYEPDYVDYEILDAVRYARALGVVVVFAAGNSSVDTALGVFAKHDENITVSASAISYYPDVNNVPRLLLWKAEFSEFGSAVDLTAPGVDIWSTISCPNIDVPPEECDSPSDYYAKWNGTSMAAPFVSGLAALVVATAPTLNPDQVRSTITTTAQDRYVAGSDGISGAGLPDFTAAINAAYRMRMGSRVPAPVSRITSPELFVTIPQGATRQFEFSLSGRNLSTYSIDFIRMVDNVRVTGISTRAVDTVTPRFSFNSGLYPSGRYLVRLVTTNRANVSTTETREFEIKSPQFTTAWNLEREELGADGRTSIMYPYGVQLATDHILVTNDVFTPTEIGGFWGRYTVRVDRLFYNGSGGLQNNEMISLGREEDALFGPLTSDPEDYSFFQYFYFPTSPGRLGVLRVENEGTEGARTRVASVGSLDYLQGASYQPDTSATSLVGFPLFGDDLLSDFRMNQLRGFSFFRAPGGDEAAISSWYAREDAPAAFAKFENSDVNRCFGQPISNDIYIGILDYPCPGTASGPVTLRRYNVVAGKTFSKYLTPGSENRIPFESWQISGTNARTYLVDLSKYYALYLAEQTPGAGIFELRLFSIAARTSLPITTMDEWKAMRLLEDIAIAQPPRAAITEVVTGPTVYYLDEFTPAFYSAGQDSGQGRFQALRRYSISSGQSTELAHTTGTFYHGFYRIGGQVFSAQVPPYGQMKLVHIPAN